MALSEHEQRLLEEMERNLQQDSDFAARVSKANSGSAGKLVGGVIMLLVGVLLLISAVILQVAFFGVAAFLVMVAGLSIAAKNFTLPQLPEIKTENRGGFYEDRWNQRFGDQ